MSSTSTRSISIPELRDAFDGRLWRYARAGHVDPEGGPWRFAVAHHLADGQAVSVSAVLGGREPVLLEGSPRRVPALAPPRGRLEAVTATEVVGWAVDDDDGPITVALYVDGSFWTRVTADRPRPDLEAEGAGGHGFSVPHALATSAINLDGGGSTTMVVDGTVVNRISDAQERRVPTAVLVMAGPIPAVPPALPAAAALAPEADLAAQQADLAAIAADPGSTAGLLGSLSEPG